MSPEGSAESSARGDESGRSERRDVAPASGLVGAGGRLSAAAEVARAQPAGSGEADGSATAGRVVSSAAEALTPWRVMERVCTPGSDLFVGASRAAPEDAEVERILGVLGAMGMGPYVMTAEFEGVRAGIRVLSVSPASTAPLLVSVSVRKGHAVEPLIRDSRSFALCSVRAEDRLTLRKFPEDGMAAVEDPFDALTTKRVVTGSPVLVRSPAAVDCEVVRHFDLEGDHELYVGLVLGAYRPER